MSSARNKRLVVSALMLALALVLPYFTGGIPAIGNLLLPMHLAGAAVRLSVRRRVGAGVGLPPPCSAPCWRAAPNSFPPPLHGL